MTTLHALVSRDDSSLVSNSSGCCDHVSRCFFIYLGLGDFWESYVADSATDRGENARSDNAGCNRFPLPVQRLVSDTLLVGGAKHGSDHATENRMVGPNFSLDCFLLQFVFQSIFLVV